MEFKEILDAWEKKHSGAGQSGQPDMEEWISRYPPKGPKETREEANREQQATGPPDPRTQEPQATLDLHGMNSRKAEKALESFVLACRSRGVRKALIVHGKGHHSQGEPVLQGVVRKYLEKSPYTGASGPAQRRHGGRGATWVVVRKP